MAQTLYPSIDIGVANKPKITGIILPAGFTAPEKLTLLVYFHGISAPPIKDYFSLRGFPKIVDGAKKTAYVLAAPTLGTGAEYGTLDTKAGARGFVSSVLQALVDQGIYTSLPSLTALVLAGHSGGGRGTQAMASILAGETDMKVMEVWGFDFMYMAGKANPTAAPKPLTFVDPGYKTAKDMPEWTAALAGSMEKQWFDWCKSSAARKFRLFWGTGGTQTRTANLDLQRQLDGTPNIEVNPTFYTAGTGGGAQRVSPDPSPLTAHDLVPQTYLGKCIAESGNLA
jgi:hypothetical protein